MVEKSQKPIPPTPGECVSFIKRRYPVGMFVSVARGVFVLQCLNGLNVLNVLNGNDVNTLFPNEFSQLKNSVI